ncbi:MAG: glycoside hydrolase family protein [Puniceicoccaceae bacterium 5H]|nr:MAG: glycoside hydrolase family protein [Puniceicoccaceae bacterium 5H]
MLRRAFAKARVKTGGVARFGLRLFSMLEYGWHLAFWSRLSAARFRREPVRLPPDMLASKGIQRQAPALKVEGLSESKAFDEGFAAVYAYLFSNLQNPDMLAGVRHVRPGPAFRGIYLWDSAFIARVWQDWDPTVGLDALRAVMEVRDGDRLQHVVADFVASRYTQPPLIGWAAVEVAKDLPDEEQVAFFKEVYPILDAYQRWLVENRRHPNGLYFWEHAYESGVENAPRFSNTDESRLLDTRRQAAPDMSAYVVLQLESLAAMAQHLGLTDEAAQWQEERDQLARLINEHLWDPETHLYYDIDLDTGDFVKCPTIASLMPLWAGVPDAERAQCLVEWIQRRDGFGTPMPFPSVVRGDSSFEKDMWRGPVWINVAYGGIQGLLRYGYHELAGKLAYRLCKHVYLVFHTERRVYEFYDPELLHTQDLKRKQGNWHKALTLGKGPQRAFVGWTGLVNRMVIEVLFGVEIDDDRLTLHPRFPSSAEDSDWVLHLPSHDLTISLHCMPGKRHSGVLETSRGQHTFELPRGEKLEVRLSRIGKEAENAPENPSRHLSSQLAQQ